MASHLILLDTPCELHIPYFAMPLPASRENEIARLNIDSDLIKIVGRRCAAWIKARLEHDKIELVQTRDYVPLGRPFIPSGCSFGMKPPPQPFSILGHVIAWMSDLRRSARNAWR